jgi:hypothetical protein
MENEKNEELTAKLLLDPIFKEFAKSKWNKTKWIKLVFLVMICNGGPNHIVNVGDMDDETV